MEVCNRKPLDLMLFNWNGLGTEFCQYDCVNTDILGFVKYQLKSIVPILVAFTFQQVKDATHVLYNFMVSQGYTLVYYDSVSNCDLYLFTLCVGVVQVKKSEQLIQPVTGIQLQVILPNKNVLTLANILHETKITKELYRSLIKELNNKSDYLIIGGSFAVVPKRCNLEEHVDSEWDGFILQESTVCNTSDDKFKELNVSMGVFEGVDNIGPEFAPTCYLKPNRKSDNVLFKPSFIKTMEYTSVQVPKPAKDSDFIDGKKGWCDRIFYSSKGTIPLVCDLYERYDNSDISIANSSHALVYGLYTFTE